MQNLFSAAITPSLTSWSGMQKTVPGADILAYTHSIATFGGYDTAQLSIKIRQKDLDSFLFNAIGNKIVIMTGESQIIWEGFINEISLTYNNNDIVIGPLLDVANKVLVRYTEFITGVPGTTTYANDLVSQGRYGTFTKILSAATVSALNAENIRDHYLKDNKYPAYNVNLTTQPSGTILQLDLNCLGFYHLLSTYVYNNPATGTYTVREKIIDVLEAHPNSIFKKTGLLAGNTLSVPIQEDEDRLAIDVIKELVALGADTSNERMTFGIYNDMSIMYEKILDTVGYYFRNYNNSKYIFNAAGGKVHMATLRPGQYVGVNDITDVISDGTRSISKRIFAENVVYTAPYGLSVTGTNVSTLQQKLAKLGLSGL